MPISTCEDKPVVRDDSALDFVWKFNYLEPYLMSNLYLVLLGFEYYDELHFQDVAFEKFYWPFRYARDQAKLKAKENNSRSRHRGKGRGKGLEKNFPIDFVTVEHESNANVELLISSSHVEASASLVSKDSEFATILFFKTTIASHLAVLSSLSMVN